LFDAAMVGGIVSFDKDDAHLMGVHCCFISWLIRRTCKVVMLAAQNLATA